MVYLQLGPGGLYSRRMTAIQPTSPDSVISDERARELADELMGRAGDADANAPWRLVSFDQGWLILVSYHGKEQTGGRLHVIERASGHIRVFPSGISPRRITQEYSSVSHRGKVLDD